MERLVYSNTTDDYYVRFMINHESRKQITWSETETFYYHATVTFIIHQRDTMAFKQSVYDWVKDSFTSDEVLVPEPEESTTFYTLFLSDISLMHLFKLAY